MGFRFRKSIGSGPLRINLSKSGVGYSIGGKGFRYTKKANGGTRTTASIPGTGISYVKDHAANKQISSPRKATASVTSDTPKVAEKSADTITKYCKHCYRMIEDGTEICPACGKSQRSSVGIGRVFLGIGVWFATMFLILIVATALNLAVTDGIGYILYTLTVAIVPVVLAIKVALPKKRPIVSSTQRPKVSDAKPNSNLSIPLEQPKVAEKENPNLTFPPVSSAPPQVTSPAASPVCSPVPDEPPKVTEEDTRPAVDNEKVEAILESLRQGTFRETMDELYGNESDDSNITKTYKVTGMTHYMDNIMYLAFENPYYEWSKQELIQADMTEEKIWKYEFNPSKFELLPEPDNPYDPNAIKVLVDGEHIGYIKKGSCAHVLKLLEQESITGGDCIMGGGPYKYIHEEYDYDLGRDRYVMEEDEISFFVHLKITEQR